MIACTNHSDRKAYAKGLCKSCYVCGLHVWDNLQLLAPEANLRKNNRFDPETYHAS